MFLAASLEVMCQAMALWGPMGSIFISAAAVCITAPCPSPPVRWPGCCLGSACCGDAGSRGRPKGGGHPCSKHLVCLSRTLAIALTGSVRGAGVCHGFGDPALPQFPGPDAAHGIRHALTSGIACVECAIQQITKDSDWIIHPEDLAALVAMLCECERGLTGVNWRVPRWNCSSGKPLPFPNFCHEYFSRQVRTGPVRGLL